MTFDPHLITAGILCAFFLWFVYLLVRPNKLNPYANYTADLIAYSIGEFQKHSVKTWHLMYPRFIHSEMMTHKAFSRSAASSRAIPVKRVLEQVWYSPALPIKWGYNQPGMQASVDMQGFRMNLMRNLWQLCGRVVCCFVWVMMKLRLHKQVANRLLEPWQLMQVTLTTVHVANFFNLRIHKDAQPEIHHLAVLMKNSLNGRTPKLLKKGEWHLPWIQEKDHVLAKLFLKKGRVTRDEPSTREIYSVLLKMSAARCARSSYANFNGERTVEGDLATYSKLVESEPVHASPCEHQVSPDELVSMVIYKGEGTTAIHCKDWDYKYLHGNMTGYICYRNTIPGHYLPD